MITRYFTARLLNDAVISERSATTGGHRTLDYIPGATLLGAVAARYADFAGDDAYTVFHSGKVRFGNAYPLSPAGEPALPVPLAWHTEKGEELHGSVKQVKNLLHATRADFETWDKSGCQQKQLRSGYFTPSGAKIDPVKSYRLKTALNRDKQGMAEEAQLFGYQSLAADSLWHFSIAFDDLLTEELREKVVASLGVAVRVGRSRSAEYGLLSVHPVDSLETPVTLVAGDNLIIYCVSDLALTDPATGASTLIPSGAHFGFPDASFVATQSYLRVRKYAPFNRTRKRFDLERQVIAKGSVLLFSKLGGFSAQELSSAQSRLAAGVGLHRQDGVGQLLVNPPFLAGFTFKATSVKPYPLPVGIAPGKTPELAGWLTAKAGERQKQIDAIGQVDGWVNALVKGPCPKNSQWGQLRTIALQNGTLDAIRTKVGNLCTTGVSQKQWDKGVTVGKSKTTYGKFLLETVLPQGIELADAKNRLYLLGNRLPRKNNQRTGGDL